MVEIIFKNYYYLLGLDKHASVEEIKSAIDKLEGKRSEFLLSEIKMVLLNKELKKLYDTEYEMYSKSDNKSDYIIKNDELKDCLNTIRQQEGISVSMATKETVNDIEKSQRFKKSIIWTIIGLISLYLIKCIASFFANVQ